MGFPNPAGAGTKGRCGERRARSSAPGEGERAPRRRDLGREVATCPFALGLAASGPLRGISPVLQGSHGPRQGSRVSPPCWPGTSRARIETPGCLPRHGWTGGMSAALPCPWRASRDADSRAPDAHEGTEETERAERDECTERTVRIGYLANPQPGKRNQRRRRPCTRAVWLSRSMESTRGYTSSRARVGKHPSLARVAGAV
jgi:hypothetical protein